MKALHSVRLRLLVLALLPLVVLLPLLMGLTMLRWVEQYDQLLFAKVASDLRVAEQYFGRIEAAQAADVTALGQSVRFARAHAAGPSAVAQLLATEVHDTELDFLHLYRAGGKALPAAARALVLAAEPGSPSTGLALLDADVLAAFSPELAARAELALVPTEAARHVEHNTETRGLVLLSAHRLEGSDQLLVSGRLLNRNLDIIDTMNALVYRGNADPDSDPDNHSGTTTLFLEDVRVSTNVRLFEGARALGTRVSEAVWQQVMQSGEPWLDRAFVVNNWYISGYVPLSDATGRRIGMLYTGFLEAPYAAERNSMIYTLALAFIAVICLSVPVFLLLARGIFTPLERMNTTMARVERGALDARIGPVESHGEIGAVARHLDRLLDQVQERDESLRGYAGKLNELVDQRTEELREANSKLEETFAQLVMSEKLASIGEITAGVAHEINNPVAVIQGNLEILQAEMAPAARAVHRTELELIDAQTHRINVIVAKLLNFTRPGDICDIVTAVDARTAAEDAVVLVAADLRKHGIDTQRSHTAAPAIHMVETELQQVLVNLMINAAQAMPEGGTLSLETGPLERNKIAGTVICVGDTGPGIASEHIDKVFDPFFSTKPAEGTGLGLSISQSLMTRAGGIITVRSEAGRGATFCAWHPAADI